MAYLKKLENLREKLSDSKDAADAISDLVAFSALLITGTAVTGGAITLPLLVATSAKAAAALSKLTAVLIPREKEESDVEDPAERIDEIFYVLAQKAYLSALEKLLPGLTADEVFDGKKHQELTKVLTTTVVVPSEAEARFQFGWSPSEGPLELYASYSAYLLSILVSFGISHEAATKKLRHIEKEARNALHRELVSKRKDRRWLLEYQLLENSANTLEILRSFAKFHDRDMTAAWQQYLQALSSRPGQPIWGEGEQKISISQLYVEPGYRYAQQRIAGWPEQPRSVSEVNLQNFLSALLSARRPSAELIFVMGGPGSGKTSLTEVFCAGLAKTGKVRVVLVPAKRLDPAGALLPEAQKFLRDYAYTAVADSLGTLADVVLVIDGFDELAQATRNSLEAFFRGAHDLVRERASNRLRIVLTGRPTLFSENDVVIPSGSHVITLQPFDRGRVEEWSVNWRRAAGGSFEGVRYFESVSEDLREIACQPMLLYLLARMHGAGKPVPLDLKGASGGARYHVYKEILDWVSQRQIGKGSDERLRRFLQLAGLATHQSGQRVLHWSFLQKTLEESSLTSDPGEREAKAYGTILSFAFSSRDQRSWEFTHKSFGEALAAEAISEILVDLAEEGKRGERWKLPLTEAARLWVATFGAHFVTTEVLDFCSGWFSACASDLRHRIVERLAEIYAPVLGNLVASEVSRVARDWERPLADVLGHASRSWFALTNLAIAALASADTAERQPEVLRELGKRNGIGEEVLRRGALLCHLVSPISRGDFTRLFEHTRKLAIEDVPEQAPTYPAKAQILTTSLWSTAQKIKAVHASAFPHVLVENEDALQWLTADEFRHDRFNPRFILNFHSTHSTPTKVVDLHQPAYTAHTEADQADSWDAIYDSPIERAFMSLESALGNKFEPSVLAMLQSRLGVNLTGLSSEEAQETVLEYLKSGRKLSKNQ